MYQVNIGDKILYYPGSEDAQIYDTELNEEIGLAGEFKFKVPPDNPAYSELSTGKLVTIYKNKEEFWRGEIRDIKTDFAKVADVYVVEDLAWLADEFITPTRLTTETYAQRFQAAITAYNSTRSSTPERQFQAGYITNVTSTSTCNWTTQYEWSILESLRECICNAVTETGYIRVRRQKEGGVVKRYIDIVRLSDYGVASDQPIEYGYNLLDYIKDSDYGNLTNVLTPYGDEIEDREVYEDYAERLRGNTIQNTASINAYGRHAKAVIFNGVNTAASLNALAASYLSRYCQPQLTMEVQAVDLAEIETAEEIRIGDSVRIIAKPFAIDQRLYLTQIKRDIQNIDRNTITMSGHVMTGRTLTSQLVSTTKAVEEIPSESSILKAAKKNALAMLLDETQGGYVVFEYDSNNTNMVAINICDAKTIAASEKRWKWSQNGFGFMKRSGHGTEISPAWTEMPVAITMAGEIVADAITAGTLSADRMRGGTLALGGSAGGAYKNGVLYIYNASNTLVGVWNSSGITMYDGSGTAAANVVGKWNTGGIDIDKGDINLGGGNFHVTNNGQMTAKSGYIGNGSTGWNIGNNSIYNGCDGVDTDAAGTYVGTDGIRNQSGTGSNKKYVQIKNGEINANAGSIGGFEITSNALGNKLGSSTCVGMISEEKLFAWHSSYATEIDFGRIRIGTGSSSSKGIYVYASSSNRFDGNYIKYGFSDIYSSDRDDTVAWSDDVSDRRLKTGIKDITSSSIRAFFERIKPSQFKFKKKAKEDAHNHFGIIAQNIDEALKEANLPRDGIIHERKRDGILKVNYRELHGLELAGIKDLYELIVDQQQQINELRKEIRELKGETNG